MRTLSTAGGIGGSIKAEPEDFVVKEITGKGIVLEQGRQYTPGELGENEAQEGRFASFVLEKRNWETIRAVMEIAKRLGRGRKSVGYAGTKDKRAVTVQLACIYGAEPSAVRGVSIKDISINAAWRSNGIELGSNLGNAFSVRIRDPEHPENVEEIIRELNSVFPNYFDRQRFGYRLNNLRIGLAILQDNHEEAAMTFLTDSSNETNEEAIEARKRLKEELDFQKALEYFPRHLRYERTMIDYLSRYKNFANAIRKLPRGIAIMFVHSVEDFIFNAALEKRIEASDFRTGVTCKNNFYGFPDLSTIELNHDSGNSLAPLVGYETSDGQITDYEKGVMEMMGINKGLFKIAGMPELSMKGAFRPILSPFRDFSYSLGDQFLANFSIPSGSYATILLDEISKNGSVDLDRLFNSRR